MKYETFKQNLIYELTRRTKELGEIMIMYSKDNNGQTAEYLYLKRKDGSYSLKIAVKHIYDVCTCGECIGTILKRLIAEMTVNAEDLNDNLIKDWTKARTCVYPKLINTRLNAEFLKGVPHKEILDLSAVYYIEIEGVCSGNKAYGLVNNSVFSDWEISLDSLHEESIKNLYAKKPALFGRISMSGICLLGNLKDVTKEQLGEITSYELYFLTNEDSYAGASYLCCPDILEDIKHMFDGDVVILSSSMHEFIVVKKDHSLSPENMAEIVRHINDVCIKPNEVLSESVYEYSGGELRIIA